MAPKQEYRPPHWQVDRHIPVALILAMVVQTISIVWWAASLTGRVNELEQKVHAQGVSIAPAVERSIRLETRLENLMEGQARVENLIRNSYMTYAPPADSPRPLKPVLNR